MYLRTTKRRNADGSEVRYYQLAENEWDAARGYVRLSTTDQAEMPDGRGACEVAGKHGPMPFRAASELRMLAPLRERRGARDVDASRACDRA